MLPRNLRLLIRADAGPRIGTGHLMRCMAIAQAWKGLGGQVAFACGTLPGTLENRLHQEGFLHYTMANSAGDGTDAREVSEIATAFSPDWMILDGYQFDDHYQSRLRTPESKLMVIDDYGHGRHTCADLVLNQNAYANQNTYHHLEHDRVLAGPRFLLLREEFAGCELAKQEQRVAKSAKRILVTLGGSDPENVTLRVLQALETIGKPELVVDAVLGAGFQHLEEVREFKRSANLNLRIHRNVDRMSTLMTNVDLTITAGGSTCYELARCGVPAMIVSIADNQIPIAKSLNDQGIAIDCGDHTHLEEAPFAKSIAKVLRNPELRRAMSNRGPQLVDGNGAARTARRMAAELYALRPATADDADWLLSLRNEPEFRAMSFDSQAVSAASNRSWLTRILHSPDLALWIAHYKNDEPIGYVSLNVEPRGIVAEFNICLHLSERGKGHGPILIEKASRLAFSKFGIDQIRVQIKHGTQGTQHAFQRAGYRPIAPTVVNGQTACQMKIDRRSFDSPNVPNVGVRKSA